MNGVPRNAARRQLALGLWPASTAEEPMAPGTRRRVLAISQLNPQGTFETADMIAGDSVATSMMGRTSLGASRAVGFDHHEAGTGGPRIRMAKVAEKAESIVDIRRFWAFTGRANVLRNCELSLRCVESGGGQ